jgi:hypothetical protein
MDPIQAAIEDIENLEPGEQFSYTKIAAKYGVVRSTLTRRHQGQTSSERDKNFNQQKLNPQQELELVRYIKNLTKQGLPPTREMIRNFSSEVAHKQLSESWVTRFINRHEIHLISKWTSAMDRTRHLADSESKYRLYFELLHTKITEYHLEARDIYNMDEKGFLIGLIGRSKRIFSRRQWEKKEVRASLQDGSREFLTVLACCCADGSSLPPALIYAAKKGAIRSTWVEDIKAGEHEVFVSSSPTGWSNDDIGLAWLEQVFDRYTKQRSGRWRLLILDGHGSHVTMEFINYCGRHRILLIIFPPHSTHTLLLELNLTLQSSLLTLLLNPCFLEFLLRLILLSYCFSSLSLTQLARRPVNSATMILLALLKVESFALLLMLLVVLKSLL